MDKKAAIIVIIIILVITTLVYLAYWQKNEPTPVSNPTTTTMPVKNANQTNPATTNLVDTDTQAIEGDLNSISDEDFDVNDLSDSNIGL